MRLFSSIVVFLLLVAGSSAQDGKKSLLQEKFPEQMKSLLAAPYGAGEKRIAHAAAKVFNDGEVLLADKREQNAVGFTKNILQLVLDVQEIRLKDGKKRTVRHTVVWDGAKWTVQDSLPKTYLTDNGYGAKITKVMEPYPKWAKMYADDVVRVLNTFEDPELEKIFGTKKIIEFGFDTIHDRIGEMKKEAKGKDATPHYVIDHDGKRWSVLELKKK